MQTGIPYESAMSLQIDMAYLLLIGRQDKTRKSQSSQQTNLPANPNVKRRVASRRKNKGK